MDLLYRRSVVEKYKKLFRVCQRKRVVDAAFCLSLLDVGHLVDLPYRIFGHIAIFTIRCQTSTQSITVKAR
jgi:hypothetical protein